MEVPGGAWCQAGHYDYSNYENTSRAEANTVALGASWAWHSASPGGQWPWGQVSWHLVVTHETRELGTGQRELPQALGQGREGAQRETVRACVCVYVCTACGVNKYTCDACNVHGICCAQR